MARLGNVNKQTTVTKRKRRKVIAPDYKQMTTEQIVSKHKQSVALVLDLVVKNIGNLPLETIVKLVQYNGKSVVSLIQMEELLSKEVSSDLEKLSEKELKELIKKLL